MTQATLETETFHLRLSGKLLEEVKAITGTGILKEADILRLGMAQLAEHSGGTRPSKAKIEAAYAKYRRRYILQSE